MSRNDHTPFNPYLHGTNSSSLPLLARTDFTLMSPLRMMRKYGLAPVTGEIIGFWGGGHDSLGVEERVCFGQMHAKAWPQGYGIEQVLDRYAQSSTSLGTVHGNMVSVTPQELIDTVFGSINKLLVQLARQKAIGALIDIDITAIRATLVNGIRLHRLLAHLGSNIHPDFILFETIKEKLQRDLFRAFKTRFEQPSFFRGKRSLSEEYGTPDEDKQYAIYQGKSASAKVTDIEDTVYLNMTYQALFSRLASLCEDVPNVDTSDSNLTLALLELPSNAKMLGPAPHPDPIPARFTEKQLFTKDKPTYSSSCRPLNLDIQRYAENKSYGYGYHKFLSMLIDGQVLHSDLQKFATEMSKIADILDDRLATFDHILQQGVLSFDSQEEEFLRTRFPLVLISESDKFKKVGEIEEFQSTSSLIIGEDILMIATDTEAHQQAVCNYLKAHNIHNVTVTTIDKLLESKNTGHVPEGIKSSPADESYSRLCKI